MIIRKLRVEQRCGADVSGKREAESGKNSPYRKGNRSPLTAHRLPAAALMALLAVAGCAVGPDYLRPASNLPATYEAPATNETAAVVDAQWWKQFHDPVLDVLVEKALVNNSDLQLAVARVEEADALLRQAGASLFPEFDVVGSDLRSRSSTTTTVPATAPLVREDMKMTVGTTFELDIWGRLRRGRESTRADDLASRYGRDTVRLTVAGLVSQAYIASRTLDAQVAASRSTLESRDKAYGIAKARFDSGLSSELDLRQAESAQAAAKSQTADLVQSRALAEHQLALLTGDMALKLPVGDLDKLPLPPVPPAGLPSSLLEARPDVRQAEENLAAANARIGLAKAALFPTISLTAALGGESAQLAGLFGGASKIWTSGFGLMLPIFTAGRLEGQVDQATAQQKQALASYQKAVQSAFKDVKDALVSLRQTAEKDEALGAQVQAAKKSLALAQLRYESGYSPFLEVLDAQRTANDATQNALKNRQARLSAAVDLFRALGGGWKDSRS
jgi:multidrug efflux system outer membrane protein